MRLFKHVRSLGVVIAITVLSALGAARVALACSHAPPAPPTICIQQLDATHFCILFKNYNTAGGATPGQFCTCALKRVGPILSIDTFQMLRCGSTQPIQGWSFAPNANSTNAWTSILGGNTTGFLSGVSSPIQPETCLDFYFVVTVGPGTTAPFLANVLAASGPIVGNGEAGPNGVPLAGSFEFRPAGPILILPPPCRADINGVGGLTVQDIFDFLALWFAGNPLADFNGVGGITVQDIFDFLAAWFAGCP